jgi:hypothetical protein
MIYLTNALRDPFKQKSVDVTLLPLVGPICYRQVGSLAFF